MCVCVCVCVWVCVCILTVPKCMCFGLWFLQYIQYMDRYIHIAYMDILMCLKYIRIATHTYKCVLFTCVARMVGPIPQLR